MDRPDRSGRCVLGDGLPHCWDGGRAFWVFVIAGPLSFSLWGLILKLQALKVCYDLDGIRLFGVIALALLLNGSLVWVRGFS